MATTSVTLALRVNEPMARALRIAAAQDSRTVAGLLRLLVERHLQSLRDT